MGRSPKGQICGICQAPSEEYHGHGMCSKCFWFWVTKPARRNKKLTYLCEMATEELKTMEVPGVEPTTTQKKTSSRRKGRSMTEVESLVLDCLVHSGLFPRGCQRLNKSNLVKWLRDRQREDPRVRVSGPKEVLVKQALKIISQPGRRNITDKRVGTRKRRVAPMFDIDDLVRQSLEAGWPVK